jgi:hypothetical protein
MATTEILASGTSGARSSTITLATGESRTLILRSPAGPNTLPIQIQASDNSWVAIGTIDNAQPARQIYGPGVYSVYRDTTANAAAVDAAS